MNHVKPILGIHIDDDSLSIVHLERTSNTLKVRNRTVEPLEAGIVKDGLIIDRQKVSRIIKGFTRANQLKSCKAIISLPCSTVRLKPSEFPAQTDTQLQKQVEDQVAKYSLFQGQELVFDFCTFKEPTQTSNKQTVLQAVTARQTSDACLKVARIAGLELMRVEPVVLPIIKLALDQHATDPRTVSLVLTLDSVSGNLTVFKNGVPKLCQNLNIGTKDLSQEKDGFTPLAEQMGPVLEFAHSIADSQQFVLRVVTACNSEKLQAIISQIKHSFSDVTVELINCSQIAKQFGIQGTDWEQVPLFALTLSLTALGACEYDGQLNLTSQESLTIQKTHKEMSFTAKAVAAVVLFSIAALLPLEMKIKRVNAVSFEIEAKVTETIPMKDKISDLKKQIRQMNEKQTVYDAAGKKLIYTPWPQVMQAIGDTVPSKVRMVDISTTNSGNFTLLGEALTERYIYKFVKELQNNKFVESAKVEEIEYDDNGGQTLVDYKINCKIRIPESNL